MERSTTRAVAAAVLAPAVLLLLPWIAMQFTGEVNWVANDFVAAGVLLWGTAFLLLLGLRKAANRPHRAAVGLALGAALLLIWINMAVGIIGDEDNPANLMYLGVLAVGGVGAMIARFRPHGMAVALLAATVTLALTVAIALVTRANGDSLRDAVEIVVPNSIFLALFGASAWLFRRAAATPPQP